jgi:hypothetical protein
MAHIPPTLRQAVVERARGRCEYCLTWQAIVVEMEVDHVQPEAAGGLDENGESVPDLCGMQRV